MREIIFKGKQTDNGEWVEGSLINAFEYICILQAEDKLHPTDYPYLDGDIGTFDGKATPVIPETVGQYTGLTDKNGKKIFEGDIHEHNNERWYVRFGNFYDAELEDNFYGWHCVDNKGRAYGFNGTESLYMNIIGNTHDNPELTEETK